MKRLIALVTIVWVPVFSVIKAPASTYSFSNLIDSTVAAPTGNYINIGEAAISGNKVAFKASYDQGFLGILEGIFTSTGGPRTLIAQELHNAPPRNGFELGGGTLSALGRPAIDGNSVYFDAEVFHSDSFLYAYGIFQGEGIQSQGRPLVSTAVSQRQAPQFARTRNTAYALVSDGYFSYRSSSSNTTALDTIRVSNRDRSNNTRIIGVGDVGPDGDRFSFIDLNYGLSGGTVAFRGGYRDQEGIFTSAGGPLTTIAKEGDAAPYGGAFTSLVDPSISGSKVAFLGTTSDSSGIFIGDGGPLLTVIRTGDETPSGGAFSSFSVPAIGGTTVAFRGSRPGAEGIYTKTGAVLTEVVATGSALFGSTVSSLQFSALGLDPDGSGNLTFTYGLADGRTGVAMATPGVGRPTIFEDAAATIPVPDSVGIQWIPAPNFAGRHLTRSWLYGADLRNANAQSADLSQANLRSADLTNADLSGANLTGAVLASAALTEVDFTDATIRRANIERTAVTVQTCQLFCSTTTTYYGGISPAQLAVTADFRNGDLSEINLTRNNLADANLAGQNLNRAILRAATLTDASIEGANIAGASFGRYSIVSGCYKAHWGACTTETTTFGSGITSAQLASTSSYDDLNLAGVDFSGNQLTDANLDSQNLANASFYGANLTGATFRGANITNVNFHAAQLDGGNFRGADARGSLFTEATLTNTNLSNFIAGDGHVDGIDIVAGETIRIRDYDGDAEQNLGAVAITVEQAFQSDSGGTLQMLLEADAWNSTISFAPGIPVALDGNLELAFAPGTELSSQIGRSFRLFDWNGVEPTGMFTVVSPQIWDLSKLYTTGEVQLQSAHYPGDFNHDGFVDAADYTEWRDGLGTIYTADDYLVWKSNFGATAFASGGDAAGSAIPEPLPIAFLIAIALNACWMRVKSNTHTTWSRDFA